jgi:hypothetical protein
MQACAWSGILASLLVSFFKASKYEKMQGRNFAGMIFKY